MREWGGHRQATLLAMAYVAGVGARVAKQEGFMDVARGQIHVVIYHYLQVSVQAAHRHHWVSDRLSAHG